MQRILLCPLVGVLLIFGACSSSHQGNGEASSDTAVAAAKPNAEHVRPEIGPRSCRIVGTIVAIDSTLQTNDPTHPTAKYPSIATVRVDSVVMTGPSFPKPFAAGASITVTFAYTLSPTAGIVQHARKQYPGLGVGSRFQADVLDRNLPIEKASRQFSTTPLVIFDYQPL